MNQGIFLSAVLACWGAAAFCEEDPPEGAERIVGRVYGKAITAGAIGLNGPVDTTVDFDARDRIRWSLMGKVQEEFGGPVMERFIRERKVVATPGEISQFKEASRKRSEEKIKNEKVNLDLLKKKREAAAEPERGSLDKEIKTKEGLLALLTQTGARQPADRFAEMMIKSWKTERELYRQHGGRVIYQQFGNEALDARRKMYEEAEKRGDISFTDDGVRHLFYHYYRMKHLVMKPEEASRAFEKPWFFEGGSGK